MPDIPTSKDAVILKLLSEDDTMLCLDARHQGVRVPPQHANQLALRLILNLNFPQPIDVTPEGVSAQLSFNGRRCACYIPMAALWAAFDPQTMQGMMWPDSMPAEVKAEFAARQRDAVAPLAPTPEDARAAPEPRGHLRTVTGSGKKGPGSGKKGAGSGKKRTTNDAAGPPPQRGHLRIIK